MRAFFSPTDDSKYTVVGTIAFTFATPDTPEDIAELRAVIIHANLFHPWKSDHPASNDSDDMPHLSNGRVCVRGGRKTCWFEINLPHELTKSQIYAYQKYLDGIAESLSHWHIRLNGVREVSSSIKIISALRAYPVAFKGRPA